MAGYHAPYYPVQFLGRVIVFETFEFNNVNVLQFLLSKVNTLDGLLKMARRKSRRSVPSLADVQVVFETVDP
jgi:hypothetical protein